MRCPECLERGKEIELAVGHSCIDDSPSGRCDRCARPRVLLCVTVDERGALREWQKCLWCMKGAPLEEEQHEQQQISKVDPERSRVPKPERSVVHRRK